MDNGTPIFNICNVCDCLFVEILNKPDAGSAIITELLHQRFKQWATYLGVFAKQNMSLDTRLKYSESICQLVMQFLQIVFRNLDRICKLDENIEANSTSAEELQRRVVSEVDHAPESGTSSPLVESLRALKMAIDGLYRLGAAIRQSSSLALNERVRKFAQENVDVAIENIIFLRLKHKFFNSAQKGSNCKSPLSLYRQLAVSISFRYMGLLYRKRRQREIEKHREDESHAGRSAANQDYQKTTLSQTLPQLKTKGRINEIKKLAVANPGRGGQPEKSDNAPTTINTDHVLQNYAAGEKFFNQPTSIISANIKDVKYPDPPTIDSGTHEAKCPFCGRPITEVDLKRKDWWHHHLNQDLELYTCLSEACAEPPQFFSRFEEWSQHMHEHHSPNWIGEIHKPLGWCCDVEHDDLYFEDEDEYELHVRMSHPEYEAEKGELKEWSEIQRKRPPYTCPICNYVPEELTAILPWLLDGEIAKTVVLGARAQAERDSAAHSKLLLHIGTHLKQLGLMSIVYFGDSEDNSSISSHTSANKDGNLAAIETLPGYFDPQFEDYSMPTEPEPLLEALDWSAVKYLHGESYSQSVIVSPYLVTLSEELNQAKRLNVIYIRFYPPQPQDLERITASSNGSGTLAIKKRKWEVSIQVNNNEQMTTYMEDPFLEADYKTFFQRYLHRSLHQHHSNMSSQFPNEDTSDKLAIIDARIDEYGRELFNQLEKATNIFYPESSEAQIYVLEHHDSNEIKSAGSGPHCLVWELLEALEIPRLPKLRLRITRIGDFPTPQFPPAPADQCLAAIQADPESTFKILLVIARNFTRTSAELGSEPGLAQWPILMLQKELSSRLMFEIVRPGSFEGLNGHLAMRAKQGIIFNIVHFDSRGRFMEDESGTLVSWLLFAKQHNPSASGFSIPETEFVKAEVVAALLAQYQVENVVLHACLLTCNWTSGETNIAHDFLRHGISNVSVVSPYADWGTATAYIQAFYDNLLIKCLDFNVAAQQAREALRRQSPSVSRHQDVFLYANYARHLHQPDSMLSDVGPLPLAKPDAPKTFNTTIESSLDGISAKSPQPADNIILENEPTVRLQLHLLELEYKLVTFKIVYASDLQRPGSNLDATLDGMVRMWLSTNLIDEVCYYKAKDFAKPKTRSWTPHPRDIRTRTRYSGMLHRLSSRAISTLGRTLHIVRDIDNVLDPGMSADEVENQRRKERRSLSVESLQMFTKNIDTGNDSYIIFQGSQDAAWWRTYCNSLGGEFWLDIPWTFSGNSRNSTDISVSVAEIQTRS